MKAGPRHDARDRNLAERWMRLPVRPRIDDIRIAEQDLFDPLGIHVLAAAGEHGGQPAGKVQLSGGRVDPRSPVRSAPSRSTAAVSSGRRW
jgi:hypothetical protein